VGVPVCLHIIAYICQFGPAFCSAVSQLCCCVLCLVHSSGAVCCVSELLVFSAQQWGGSLCVGIVSV
jgi:hypothetical protein